LPLAIIFRAFGAPPATSDFENNLSLCKVGGDRSEVCFVTVSCQRDWKPRCSTFAVPSREFREGSSCRYMLNVHNLVVGTLVEVRISADRARNKAVAAGFEFLLHTCSPSRMKVSDFYFWHA
jgi:hypothetical protein